MKYNKLCVIDDNPKLSSFPRIKDFYIGTIENYVPQQNDVSVIAINDPLTRFKIELALLEKGVTFSSVIHPTALISKTSVLGEGAILAPHVVVTTDVVIGRHAHLNISASVGHDVKIGNFTTMSSYTDVTGKCDVGDFSFLGSGARILPGCRIAARTRIGAGCVVMRSVSKASTFVAPKSKRVVLE